MQNLTSDRGDWHGFYGLEALLEGVQKNMEEDEDRISGEIALEEKREGLLSIEESESYFTSPNNA